MGVTKKAKITFTCEPNLKDALEEWAQSESRTLSNLIEMLVRKAYGERFTTEEALFRASRFVDEPGIGNLVSSEPEPQLEPQPAPTKTQPTTKAKRGRGSKGAS
ncbi:hypothetical protein QUA41_28550 [Microcoleus sp. Pol11C1]|uniref:ribbon-helix-helix domain-containing protein n=1 Tax=unclassified Microcoleus TaxID=2642155 RepID=UPI002FCEAF7E